MGISEKSLWRSSLKWTRNTRKTKHWTLRGILKMRFRKEKVHVDSSPSEALAAIGSMRLHELTSGDEELYQALSRLMFLDPAKIKTPLERLLSEAQDFENKGDRLRAEIDYRIAGSIALYKGDIDGLKTYFSKASALTRDRRPEYDTIMKKSTQAINVAKKFYEIPVEIRASEAQQPIGSISN
jgi:hypothetical protein